MSKSRWNGARLRQLRLEQSLTQGQLAERVGCTWEAVSRWERGTREPGWTQVLNLCDALGVACTAFCIDPGDQPPISTRRRGRPRRQATQQPQAVVPEAMTSGKKSAKRSGR